MYFIKLILLCTREVLPRYQLLERALSPLLNIMVVMRNESVFNITLRSVSYRYSYPLERSRSTDLETSRFFYEQF